MEQKQLEKISVIDFFSDEAAVNEWLPFLVIQEPLDDVPNIWYCSLELIDEIKSKLSNASFEVVILLMSKVLKKSEDEVKNMLVVNFFRRLKNIEKQLEELIKMEEFYLKTKHHDKKFEIVKGGKRLMPFGIYNTVDRLAKGDILKWDEVFKLPYIKVFTKLRIDKENNDINYEMTKIKD